MRTGGAYDRPTNQHNHHCWQPPILCDGHRAGKSLRTQFASATNNGVDPWHLTTLRGLSRHRAAYKPFTPAQNDAEPRQRAERSHLLGTFCPTRLLSTLLWQTMFIGDRDRATYGQLLRL